jgi:hypothetical protein
LLLIGLGFVLGALPWGHYALENGFVTLLRELTGSAIADVEGGSLLIRFAQHSINLVVFGGTVITGLRPPWGIEWLAQPLQPVVLVFWLGVMAFTLAMLFKTGPKQLPSNRTWKKDSYRDNKGHTASDLVFAHLGTLKIQESPSGISENPPEHRDGIAILVGVGLTLVLGFILTPFGADPSGRYFTPLAVIMALFAGFLVIKLRDAYGRWAWVLVGLILGFNLWGTIQVAHRFPPGLTTQFDATTRLDQRYDNELISFLEEQGESRGYSTYWISYPLAFKSSERLIFIPRLPYHADLRYTTRDDRYKPYGYKVANAEKVAYITGNQPELELLLRKGLTDLQVDWQEKIIGDYHIFYQLSRRVRPDELGLGGEIK